MPRELHGRVSRRIFAPLFPRWPEDEVPVTHVTNAVHVPSWDSPWADQAAEVDRIRALGLSAELTAMILGGSARALLGAAA